jgi:hypothetical protein
MIEYGHMATGTVTYGPLIVLDDGGDAAPASGPDSEPETLSPGEIAAWARYDAINAQIAATNEQYANSQVANSVHGLTPMANVMEKVPYAAMLPVAGGELVTAGVIEGAVSAYSSTSLAVQAGANQVGYAYGAAMVAAGTPQGQEIITNISEFGEAALGQPPGVMPAPTNWGVAGAYVDMAHLAYENYEDSEK